MATAVLAGQDVPKRNGSLVLTRRPNSPLRRLAAKFFPQIYPKVMAGPSVAPAPG